MFLWAGFLICTLAIVYSGTRLTKYGDVIAEKSGLGRAWIGLVLMASVTSLPELVTGLSSVIIVGAPDIAVGDVLGSCVFNMLIIALLDAGYRIMPISAKAHQGNILSASFGILLLSAAAISLISGNHIVTLGWIGPYSILFAVVYLIGMRLVYFYEKRQIASLMKVKAIELRYKNVTIKTAVTQYGINAIIVIAAATVLPKIGEGIAITTGLGQTFVGNILIAVATSLPEIVVSFAAMRMDAVDLAIGSLFGSNIFNIFILTIDDLFFTRGPILSYADGNHVISALSAIAMISIAIIGLTYRSERKKLLLAWDSIGIIVVYLLNMMLLYTMR
jgi:cation:H+ antiporter